MDDYALIQWVTAITLFAVFSWVALDLFTDLMPLHLIDTTRPGAMKTGVILLIALGGLELLVMTDLFDFVWRGLKHLLLIDVLEMENP